MCDVIDSQYCNEGHGWKRGAPEDVGEDILVFE